MFVYPSLSGRILLISQKGLDDRPRTPVRNRHRKSSSKTSNSASESSEKSPTKQSFPAGTVDEKAEEVNKDTTSFRKTNSEDSELVSIKPNGEYEKDERHDKVEAEKGGITSGRKAGQRWERSAIRWAPLNVPLQRRLQTLVVLGHTLCIAISVSIFFFLCAIPLFWPLLIPYMVYTMTSKASTSGSLSHRSEFMRSSPIWSLFVCI